MIKKSSYLENNYFIRLFQSQQTLQAYSPKNPNGQTTMANSEPVVIASDQSTLPVYDGSVYGSLDTLWTDMYERTTTIIGHVDGLEGVLGTIDTDTGGILTAVQLLDDAVQVLGTDTYTEATSKGITLGAVRRDADTTLVGTTNEFGPLQMDANGRLKVEVFSGETLPVSLTSTTITGTVAVTQSGTWDEVGINDSGNSITVDAPVGTPVFTRLSDGSAALVGQKTSANSLPVVISSDQSSVAVSLTSTTITSIVPGTGATNLGKAIDTTTGATDTGVLALATRDDDLTTLTPVDGDNVQLRTDSEGALWTTNKPTATEGVLTVNSTSSDGGTALTSTAQAIKASAGCLYGYYIYNPNATAQFVQFYNTASGSVTVGTTNPLFMLVIPATSGANLFSNTGIQFATAMSWAATSTAGGNGAPTTALDAVAWYK